MDRVFGYWADATGLQFDEQGQTWIHAMPIGKYEHPVYGELDFTPERIQSYADSVKNKARGVELDIDYDHKAKDSKAAGWVKDADVRADGLWLSVEFTKPATEALKNKEYKYFSPEFHDEWKDAKGVVHKNVLFGGGITNRPFLKDLTPVNLSELVEPGATPKEGNKVDGKQLRKLLKLSEDATDEQVDAELTKQADLVDAPNPDEPKKDEPVVAVLSEEAIQDLTKALGETPAAKAMGDVLRVQGESIKQLTENVEVLTTANRLSEAQNTVRKLNETAAAKKMMIPASVQTQLSEALTLPPAQQAAKMLSAIEDLAKTGFVPTGETVVPGRGGSAAPGDAAKQFGEKVAELQKADPALGYADAVSKVTLAEPDLWESYRTEMFEGAGGGN